MGLSITVQKGHDFSSGNVTRAALNAGATPTIAVTGSVGGSEIAALSINNAQIKADAAIVATKLALTADSLIIGDENNVGSVLSPTSAFSSIGNDVDSNCGLLVDTGAKFELLKTDVSEIGGHIQLTKYLETVEGDDDRFWLKLSVVGETLGASHLKEEDTVDKLSIVKDAAGKFSIRDNGVHHQKLYNYRDSSGNPKAGFLYYGSGGTAKVLEATDSNQVAVTGGANGDFSLKTFGKTVDLGAFTTEQGWRRAAHGLTSVPTSVDLVLECITTDTGAGAHGYTAGDRIYDVNGGDVDTEAAGMVIHADATYVTALITGDGDSWEIPKKYGGDSPNAETHSGTGSGSVEWANNSSKYYEDFKVLAIVS